MYTYFQLSIFVLFRDKEDRLLVLIKYLALAQLLLGYFKTDFKEVMILFNLIIKILKSLKKPKLLLITSYLYNNSYFSKFKIITES